MIKFFGVLVVALTVATPALSDGKTEKADVIIYGRTSAAITAAVQVKKSGKSVIVASSGKHLGGLSHYEDSTAWRWQQHAEYGNKGPVLPQD